jgi:hypothetical protein
LRQYPDFFTIILLVIFFTLPLSVTQGYITYFELTTTITPNDAFINEYYFWWINANYVLPLLLVLALVFLLSLLRYRLMWVLGFFMCVLESWLSEFFTLLNSNAQLLTWSTVTPSINLLLTNALNKYHPFIFYLSLFFSLTLPILTLLNFFLTQRYLLPILISSYLKYATPTLILNYTAMYMGSWWALQEGTWGGWWNWDSSELFGLLPTLITLRFIHTRTSLLKVNLKLSGQLNFFFIIILMYLLIQLNFELSSHNFGSKFFFFFNSNLGLTLALPYVLVLLNKGVNSAFTYQLLVLILNIRGATRCETYFKKTFAAIPPHIILTLWFWLGLRDFFEQTLLTIFNVTFTQPSFPLDLNLVLVILFFVLFTETNYFTNALITPLTPYYLVFYSQKVKTISWLHLYLLLFTFINLLIYPLTIYIWSILVNPTLLIYQPSLFWLGVKSTSCDSWNIDFTFWWTDSWGLVTLTWLTSDLANVESLNKFILVYNLDYFFNYYTLVDIYLRLDVVMMIPLLPLLASMTPFVLYIFLI